MAYPLPSSYEDGCTFINCPQTTECTLCTCVHLCVCMCISWGGNVVRFTDIVLGTESGTSSSGVSGVNRHLRVRINLPSSWPSSQWRHRHAQIVKYKSLTRLYKCTHKFAMLTWFSAHPSDNGPVPQHQKNIIYISSPFLTCKWTVSSFHTRTLYYKQKPINTVLTESKRLFSNE